MQLFFHRLLVIPAALLLASCGGGQRKGVLSFPASAVGKEAEVLKIQVRRFEKENPGIMVDLRKTPDASDLRHQLYVQWLNARASEPDVLQLDVVWTAEFAAAGWIMPLDRFKPDVEDFFPGTIAANLWDKKLHALPWFVDVGMLYYRTDLVSPPKTFADLIKSAEEGTARSRLPYGFVWQGARYEGLVCVFLEHLGGFGGRILDEEGGVVVDSEEAVQALTFMRDCVAKARIVPEAALTWKEEETRFAFQNGETIFLRNWPYAYRSMSDDQHSKVGGKFAVTAMPVRSHLGGGPGDKGLSAGKHTATLGGSQLAINANTANPEAAYHLIEFLTRPEQMLERALMTGQYPPRRNVYDDPKLATGLAVPPKDARRIIESATPRPVTPVYAELSEILQIWLHRALTGQVDPRLALENAAGEIRRLLKKVGLD
ncbi:MAG: ABC transporter substrate-binding protein [Gemmataceae bacterium]|nr:ABC transporter substrate-binding protein [Gemmataceae bacterium]MCI0742238.1 ABC transporter substrate-binding protein [Gemmataceae bacterium]